MAGLPLHYLPKILFFRRINDFFSFFWITLQYNLDFNVLANRAGSGQFRDGEDGSGAGGVGNDGKMNSGSGSDGSMWQFGMARRAKGDGRRTRVSFLLFWVIRDVNAVVACYFYQLFVSLEGPGNYFRTSFSANFGKIKLGVITEVRSGPSGTYKIWKNIKQSPLNYSDWEANESLDLLYWTDIVHYLNVDGRISKPKGNDLKK